MLATQAAVSAALVATIQPPTDGVTFTRFIDSLTGAVIALIVNALILPADPLSLVRRAARPLLDELAATLDDIAEAILERDRGLAEGALVRARGIDDLSDSFVEAVVASREMTRFASPRRRLRGRVEGYADVATQVDLAVRNVRVLARGTIRGVRLDENVPPEIADAVRELAAAVRALADALDKRREHGARARARPARGGDRHARARGHRQPLGQRDRRPGPLDRHRPADGHGDGRPTRPSTP